MSKTAEISLTEPAATEGSSDGPATDSPGKPSPKSEANQKALSAMYDAMAPLSGKKGRKDSDDESDDKPKKKRSRGKRDQSTTTLPEENPEATTEYFKNDFSLLRACLLQTSQYVCMRLFVIYLLLEGHGRKGAQKEAWKGDQRASA